jgi:ubiquinone/menaquinone biosynthesis C-methylase UbiE
MTPEILRRVVEAVVLVALMFWMTRQCRKPAWWPGRMIARSMNVQHSGVTDWGLQHVRLDKRFTMLDVGCGGGATIRKLAAVATQGKVHGIDYSAASVATARRTNAREIESGRVDIQQGSVSHLPFPESTFDVVTAVETHYYWPDLVSDLREVRRVLKPGGKFVLIAETYKGRRFDFAYRPTMMLLRATYLTVDEHRDALTAAGYSNIEVFEERAKGWICAVGKRASSASGG